MLQTSGLSRCFVFKLGLLLPALGCSAHATHENSALFAVEQAQAREAALKTQIVELEARLSRMEARQAQREDGREMTRKLDQLVALNERILSTVRAAPSAMDEPLQSSDMEGWASGSAAIRAGHGQTQNPQSGNSEREQQIQRLVQILDNQAPPWRGGLSREKAEALRLLLQPERTLDARNPMR